ncbi:MAG: hypothetical protein JWM57_3921 [Phycisphaerales bacterium]|nr:hypothetical protein [Phycisphaerales bacterium]
MRSGPGEDRGLLRHHDSDSPPCRSNEFAALNRQSGLAGQAAVETRRLMPQNAPV